VRRNQSRRADEVLRLAAKATPPVMVPLPRDGKGRDGKRAQRFMAIEEKAGRPILRNDQGDVLRPLVGYDLEQWSPLLEPVDPDPDRFLVRLRLVADRYGQHNDHVALVLAEREFPSNGLRPALLNHPLLSQFDGIADDDDTKEERIRAAVDEGDYSGILPPARIFPRDIERVMRGEITNRLDDARDRYSQEGESAKGYERAFMENFVRVMMGQTARSMVDRDQLSEVLGLSPAGLSTFLAVVGRLFVILRECVESAPVELLTGVATMARQRFPKIPEGRAALFGVMGLAFASVHLEEGGNSSPLDTISRNIGAGPMTESITESGTGIEEGES
jgi:hypothetical protein